MNLWCAAPERITPALVDPALPLLPTREMEPRNVERLLLSTGREVEDLRRVQLYGVPSQPQYGLDVIGCAATGDPSVSRARGTRSSLRMIWLRLWKSTPTLRGRSRPASRSAGSSSTSHPPRHRPN
jgi:hypothetical protein